MNISTHEIICTFLYQNTCLPSDVCYGLATYIDAMNKAAKEK